MCHIRESSRVAEATRACTVIIGPGIAAPLSCIASCMARRKGKAEERDGRDGDGTDGRDGDGTGARKKSKSWM